MKTNVNKFHDDTGRFCAAIIHEEVVFSPIDLPSGKGSNITTCYV
jgi:hypothetical protein